MWAYCMIWLSKALRRESNQGALILNQSSMAQGNIFRWWSPFGGDSEMHWSVGAKVTYCFDIKWDKNRHKASKLIWIRRLLKMNAEPHKDTKFIQKQWSERIQTFTLPCQEMPRDGRIQIVDKEHKVICGCWETYQSWILCEKDCNRSCWKQTSNGNTHCYTIECRTKLG